MTDTRTTPEPIEELQSPKETMADAIDFRNTVRVKGKAGLFSLASNPNKAGMLGVRNIVDYKTYSVRLDQVEQLSAFRFFDQENNVSTLKDVFDRMEEKYGLEEVKEPIGSYEKGLMEVMVPNYDRTRFTVSHAVRVLAWYNYFVKLVK
jgi:hypothetical protein